MERLIHLCGSQVNFHLKMENEKGNNFSGCTAERGKIISQKLSKS